MAYTQSDFVRDLAAYSAGAIIGITRSRKMLEYAARRGISLGATIGRRAAVPAARAGVGLARRHPVPAAALGLYGAHEAGLLDPAYDYARGVPEDLRARAMESEIQRAYEMAGSPDLVEVTKKAVKRKKSQFNKAISAGMKTVKASTSYGKKGTIKNARKAFSAVTKVASAAKKRKKAPKTGIRRKIYQSVRRFF
jgi:hypothetical protein